MILIRDLVMEWIVGRWIAGLKGWGVRFWLVFDGGVGFGVGFGVEGDVWVIPMSLGYGLNNNHSSNI